MVSLKDVAAECGLSVTQVSAALNDRDDVSKETKEIVKEVAAKLGYVKNIYAQILVTQNSNQLAAIINDIDKDKNSEPSIIYNIIKGINRYAIKHGYEAVIHLNEEPKLSYLDFCKQRGIKGVILFGVNYGDETFKTIIGSDFPCVVIDIPIEGQNKGCVVINNIYYAMKATEYLISIGRKRIAMLSGHGRSIVELERRMGYEAALKKNGLSVDKELIVNANFDLEQACIETKKLIEAHPDIDGIFCASDFMALGAINALQKLEKKVPEDIALFGFDGITLGEYSAPKLSTVKQDNMEKGYQAAKLLCDILNNRIKERTVVIPCQVIIRGSS
jgi:LacI family transcriptional regulator